MAKNYTKKQVLDAVLNSRGIVSVVARTLGCNWHTARKYIDDNPKAKRAEIDEREALCDTAESTVVTLMKSDDEKIKYNAATYILDRLAKNRGYTTRHEFDHTTAGEKIVPAFGFVDVSEFKKDD